MDTEIFGAKKAFNPTAVLRLPNVFLALPILAIVFCFGQELVLAGHYLLTNNNTSEWTF